MRNILKTMKSILKLSDIVIESREGDNFINATQLCKAGGKKFNDWYRLESTKELIKELDKSLKILSGGVPTPNLVDKKVGGNHSGTWIHPQLATALAPWISPAFAVQVSKWVEEWKEYKPENKEIYMNSLKNIKPSKSTQKEKEIQLKLQKELDAKIEVKTPVGFIDCLSNDAIIKIKEVSKWKHAIGQILCYGTFYPDRCKQIYLFNKTDDRKLIEEMCEQFDIKVVFV
jgi:KilA-N domain